MQRGKLRRKKCRPVLLLLQLVDERTVWGEQRGKKMLKAAMLQAIIKQLSCHTTEATAAVKHRELRNEGEQEGSGRHEHKVYILTREDNGPRPPRCLIREGSLRTTTTAFLAHQRQFLSGQWVTNHGLPTELALCECGPLQHNCKPGFPRFADEAASTHFICFWTDTRNMIPYSRLPNVLGWGEHLIKMLKPLKLFSAFSTLRLM